MSGKQRLTIVQNERTGLRDVLQMGDAAVRLQFPAPTLPVAVNDEQADFIWRMSEGQSLWFTQDFTDWRRGGRASPNEEDIDLEYWWENRREGNVHAHPEFFLLTAGSVFENQPAQALVNGEWQPLTADVKGAVQAIAVRSRGQDCTLALAFLNTSGAAVRDGAPGLQLRATDVPLHKRYHVRGKIYLLDAGWDVLKQRILLDLY